MREEVALRVLSEIMNWDNDRFRDEFQWLRLMSRMKYDGYRDFVAGMRFIESLINWLQQFQSSERETAYLFVKQFLIYVGPAEFQHLVELVYPENVRPRLANAVAQQLEMPSYKLWASAAGPRHYRELLRRTLFLGLSDGARIDIFRRANVGLVSNEQIAVGAQNDEEKWDSLRKDLRHDTRDADAKFEFIYVLDDFVGSGSTLLRFDEEKGAWTGKLVKFWRNIRPFRETHFAERLTVCVHHYLASHAAAQNLQANRDRAAEALGTNWFPRESVEFSFGYILSPDAPVSDMMAPEFLQLVNKYYDPAIETKHTLVGRTQDVKRGYAGCSLALVLEHNTPNNSLALLWAETAGGPMTPAMRPLFRRRQRHV